MVRALVAEADISNNFPGVGIWLGGRMPEVNCSDEFSSQFLISIHEPYRVFIVVLHISKTATN